MTAVEYPVLSFKQNAAECAQTAAAQLLSFYQKDITVASIVAQVPVYIDEKGNKIGTSPGHIAAYLAGLGYETTAYVFDTELFDRSWRDWNAEQVVEGLRQRQPHIAAHSWLSAYHTVVVDGWQRFQSAGGQFRFDNLSSALLRKLLDGGPLQLYVNSTYFNAEPKRRYVVASDSFADDATGGYSLTHAVTCAGYKEDAFLIVDPDPPEGTSQRRWVAQDHLLASIMAAQTESINMLLTISKP